VVSATFAALRQNLATYLVLVAIFSGLPIALVESLLTRSASTGQLDAFRLSYLQSGIEGAFAYPLIAAVIGAARETVLRRLLASGRAGLGGAVRPGLCEVAAHRALACCC
jgi:hypothetical protein